MRVFVAAGQVVLHEGAELRGLDGRNGEVRWVFAREGEVSADDAVAASGMWDTEIVVQESRGVSSIDAATGAVRFEPKSPLALRVAKGEHAEDPATGEWLLVERAPGPAARVSRLPAKDARPPFVRGAP